MHPDVHVIDAERLGKNYYVMKLQTPVSTYLTEGSAGDFIELVEDDVRASKNFTCPFCNAKLDFSLSKQTYRCKCGAHGTRSAEELLGTLNASTWSFDQAYEALRSFRRSFSHDKEHRLIWGKAPETYDKPALLAAVWGPAPQVETREHPWLIDTDMSTEEIASAAKAAADIATLTELYESVVEDQSFWRPATCTYCKHCAMLSDNRNTIEGLPDAHWPQEIQVCVRPLNGDDFTNQFAGGAHPYYGHDFEFRATELRGYQTLPLGIVWNALMSILLTNWGKFVDKPDRGLEAYAQAPLNRFFGPVCSGFALNTEHPDLDGPCAVLNVSVVAQFGVTDFQRELREKQALAEEERRSALFSTTAALLRKLREAPANRTIMSARIEKKDLGRRPTMELIAFLEKHLTPEQRGVALSDQFRFMFNLSNAATAALRQQLLARAKEHPQ